MKKSFAHRSTEHDDDTGRWEIQLCWNNILFITILSEFNGVFLNGASFA